MATDKSKQLETTLTLVNNKLHFMGKVEPNDPVSIDYSAPLGDNLGYTSLELFLLSFSSCIGSLVLTLVRRMGRTINGFDIKASGIRREQHPTCFSSITLEIILQSPDVTEAEFEKAVILSDDKLCPVRAMMRVDIPVNIIRTIIR